MSRFTSVLLVSPLADGKTWVLMRDFGYDVGMEGSADRIDVPIGFETDFASIPRLFWTVLPKWGTYGNAAVIHDWLYWDQRRSRQAADAVLLEAMGVLGVGHIVQFAIYRAVRLLGWLAWMRNGADRAAGHDRVIDTSSIKASQVSTRKGELVQIVTHVWRRATSF
jgi:hypothetical protein